MSAPAAKITIWDAKFATVLATDVSANIVSGTYGFDANGCAAGSLATNLTWEQVESSGVALGRNGVEISMFDGDTVQHATAAGATKIYVLSTKPYDHTIVLETAQIAIDDGFNRTFLIPVTGVGTDGTGPYITVGSPATAPGIRRRFPRTASALASIVAVGPAGLRNARKPRTARKRCSWSFKA